MVKTSMETVSFETDWEFKAPVEKVYRAFTNVEALEKWSCGTMYDNIALDIDPRIGGVLHQRVRSKKDGSLWTFFGVYLAVEEFSVLEYTFDWKQDWREAPEPTVVEIEFFDIAGQTRIHLVHSQIPKQVAEFTEMHWKNFLQVLENQMG